jgi:M6 family metalloprotease-like protein
MRKFSKIFVLAVFGMLICVNFAAAMPAGDTESPLVRETRSKDRDRTLPIDQGDPSKGMDVQPGMQDDQQDTEDTSNPIFPSPLYSPPPPPTPSGFDTPVTPQTGVVPLLTVFMEWSDGPGDTPPSFVQDQLFGPEPSLNDYMFENSYGQFAYSDIGHFTWIPAWDNPSTTGDESTRTYWESAADPTYKGGTFISHGLTSLDKHGFDFSFMDYDNDGTIEFGDEVAYLMIDAMDPGLAGDYRGGSTRSMPPLTLDGKSTSGSGCTVSENSPWITLYAHELSHEVLKLVDYYGITPQPVGSFTLMGYSGAYSWNTPIGPHHLDSYYKMKMGWMSPTVVTQDGYYDIPDMETNPVAFILHDPSHGTDEYFIVENRWKGLSYDNSDGLIDPLVAPLPPADAPSDIPDQGLLIWHVDETRSWDGASTGGFPKVNLTRRGLSNSEAAFNSADNDYYDFWDGSTPLSSNWYTASNSKCGVWAVSKTQQTMRAWLDVPGPGVCVEETSNTPAVIPDDTATVTVRLINTGDTSDTFSLTVGGMTGGLDITGPGPVTLAPKAQTEVNILVSPQRIFTNAPGVRTLLVTATSQSNPAVTTSEQAYMEILPFGQPHVTIPINIREVYPGDTTYYILDVYNLGNVVDNMYLNLVGVDFGNTYEASPTALPEAWVNFNPIWVSTAPGTSGKSNLTITVPSDWAGMENTTYEFEVTAYSSITPDSHTNNGYLTVFATPESMMYYVKVELENLESDVNASSTDVKEGLLAKIHGAQAKLDQAFERYQLGEDPPASNLFRTVQNKLEAFLHLVDAQRDKKLSVSEADDFTMKAQKIIDHIDTILGLI